MDAVILMIGLLVLIVGLINPKLVFLRNNYSKRVYVLYLFLLFVSFGALFESIDVFIGSLMFNSLILLFIGMINPELVFLRNNYSKRVYVLHLFLLFFSFIALLDSVEVFVGTLFINSLILLFVGMINPKLVFTNGRKNVLLYFGVSFIMLVIAVYIFTDAPNLSENNNENQSIDRTYDKNEDD